MHSHVADCQHRLLLSQKVAAAAQRKNKVKDAHDRAVEAKEDAGELLQVLIEARTSERVLVAKLTQHRKEHGC